MHLRDVVGHKDKVNTVDHAGASNVYEIGPGNSWTDVGHVAHRLHLCVTVALGIDHESNATIYQNACSF